MPGKPGELPKEIPIGSNNWFWEDGTPVTDAEGDALKGAAAGNPSVGAGDTQIIGESPMDSFIPKKILSNAPGASLDSSLSQEDRGGLEGLLEQLQQQAATGSGSWENVLKAATQRTQATASALGQSSTNTGGGYQSALRDIGNAQSGAAQRAVGQGNILREQSKASAQDQLTDTLLAQGGQDVAQAANEAGARQGLRGANQSLQQGARTAVLNVLGGVGSALLSDGGKVPGKAVVMGDDEANDTVPAMLSPGEVVLPRTISQDPEAAADFVRSLNASRGVQHMAAGGYMDEKGDPSGLVNMSLEEVIGGPGIRAPSVDNGGRLRNEQALASRSKLMDSVSGMGARAAGQGGTSGQLVTNAGDDAIARGLAGRGPGVIGETAAGQQGAGGEAAATAGNEQAAGGRSLTRALTGQRANDLALAQAEQKAAWANTLANAGVTLENQALMTRIFSGAAQGLGALSRAGAGNSGPDYSLGDSADLRGDRGGPADVSTAEPDFGEWENPYEQKAFGGPVGYAGGGRIESEDADMVENPETGARHRIGGPDAPAQPSSVETRADRKAREYEEETGDSAATKPKKKAKAAEPTAIAKLTEFARSLGAQLPRKFAEGGGVPSDAGGAPYNPYAAFPSRQDRGPVVYVSPTPVPGTQPMSLGGAGGGAGGGAPDTGATGAGGGTSRGDYGAAGAGGASGVTQRDRGSMGASGGPAGNQVPQHEALQPRAVRPGPVELPPGVVPKTAAGAPAPDAAPPAPAPAARPAGGGVPLPPSHGLEAGFVSNEAQLANEARTEAEVGTARAEVAGLAERAKAQADAQIAVKEAHARARQQTNEAMTRWQAAQDEFSRIDSKIDMGRFWASKSTPNKLLSIIGLALGAAGAGATGINQAAAMMNNAIDRDLEAQKSEHELRLRAGGQKLAAAQTYYGMAREAGHDDIAATELAKAAALDGAALKAEQLSVATKEPVAKAKGQALAVSLKEAALEKKKTAEQQTFENRVKNQDLNIKAAAVGASAGGGKAAVKDYREAKAGYDRLSGTVSKLKSLISDTNFITEKAGTRSARMETLAASLLTQVKDAENLGALDKGAFELADRIIGDPTATFTLDSTKIAKLDELVDQARLKVQAAGAAR